MYLLITPFVSSYSLFDIFPLPLLYLLITPFVPSDNPFVIFIFPFLISSNFFLCGYWDCQSLVRRRVNQNPSFDKEQTTQWPKEKVQKDKQRSTTHTHKTKDRRRTRTPLKPGDKLRCSERVSSSYSMLFVHQAINLHYKELIIWKNIIKFDGVHQAFHITQQMPRI